MFLTVHHAHLSLKLVSKMAKLHKKSFWEQFQFTNIASDIKFTHHTVEAYEIYTDYLHNASTYN